jgi:DNA-binding NarL/FixJ family response regulator
MTAKIRILLAEDQAMVRGALTALLNLEEDLEVVAEVSQGDQVLQAARKTKPDIALLDIEMPGSDGLSAAECIAQESAILSHRYSHYLWAQWVFASGDGKRSGRIFAQRCAGRSIGNSDPSCDGW